MRDLNTGFLVLRVERPCIVMLLDCLAPHDVGSVRPSSPAIDERSNSGHVGARNVWEILHGEVAIFIGFVSFGGRLCPLFESP